MDTNEIIDEKTKNREMFVKIILSLIAVLNVSFMFLQESPLRSVVAIVINIILGVLLVRGVNIVRLIFIASVVEEFLFLLRFKFSAQTLSTFNIFKDNLYLQSLQVFCLVTFVLLVFNKDIKNYFANLTLR